MFLRQTPDEYLYHLEVLNPADAKRMWRERIKDNWNYQCAYCGSEDDLTLDHVKPRSLGGPDRTNNVICACHDCNQSKGHQDWKQWYEDQYYYSWERMKSIEAWIKPEPSIDTYKAHVRKNICYSKVS